MEKFVLRRHSIRCIHSMSASENIRILFSPLATGEILKNEIVAVMAQKYNTTIPQLCIRYVLQRGVLPLPKSTHSEYILQNADVDFEIAEEDMKYLNSLKNTVEVIFGPKKK
jgi:diketogulonate reductase-like aldo/keto reductase